MKIRKETPQYPETQSFLGSQDGPPVSGRKISPRAHRFGVEIKTIHSFVHTGLWESNAGIRCLSLTLPESLTGTHSFLIMQGWLPNESQGSAWVCLPGTGITRTCSRLALLKCGFRGSHSGPCACIASSFLLELSLPLFQRDLSQSLADNNWHFICLLIISTIHWSV